MAWSEHHHVTRKLQHLAQAFPTLRNAPGVLPWEPERLDAWASSASTTETARHAARFVLTVCDEDGSWLAGSFNVVSALAAWDAEHRRAFFAWATDPWREGGANCDQANGF
jgi:hypothetical protein